MEKVQDTEVTDVIKVLQRDINSLKDENRGTRRRALQNIKKALQRSYSKFKKSKNCHILFYSYLCQPLLDTFSDAVENCRESAVEIVSDAIESDHVEPAAAATILLPKFAKLLASRVAKLPYKETSEEVRLALVTLLHQVLTISLSAMNTTDSSVVRDSVSANLKTLSEILAALLTDKFAEVKKVCCKAVSSLCLIVPNDMHLHFARMLSPLVANISHQHHRVRRATLQSLESLVCCAKESLEKHMTERIIPAIGRLRFDGTASVRKESVVVLGKWIYEIDEELRKPFQSKILLLLLSAIGDNSAEIGKLAIDTIERTAAKLREQVLNADAPELPSAKSTMIDFESQELTVPTLPPLPEPFSDRPSNLCRGLVQHFLPSILPDVLRDLSDWTSKSRMAAVGLLRGLLVFSESSITSHLPSVLQALIKAIGNPDNDEELNDAFFDCAVVLGGYVEPLALMETLLPWAEGGNILFKSTSGRTHILLILTACIEGMHDGAITTHLNAISRMLCNEGILETRDNDLQLQVTEIVLSALEKSEKLENDVLSTSTASPENGSDFFFNILSVLLHLLALGKEQVQDQAREGIESLAERVGVRDSQDLYARYFEPLLKAAIKGHESWESKDSPGFGFFDSLLRESAGNATGEYISSCLPVFTKCVMEKRDPTLRLSTLALIETLTNDAIVAKSFFPHTETIILNIICPCITWRVGRIDGTIRKLGIACLLSMVRSESCLCPKILSEIALEAITPSLITSLSDDYDTGIRHITCLLFASMYAKLQGCVKFEHVNSVYPELLKRLDDSSDAVRLAAIEALAPFFGCALPEAFHTTCRSYTLDILFVHLDDSDKSIQDAMLRTIKAMGTSLNNYDKILDSAKKLRAEHRSPYYCDQLADYCLSRLTS